MGLPRPSLPFRRVECSRGPSGDGPETLEAGLNMITLAAGRDARDATRTQESEAVATMSIGSRIGEQRCEIGWSQVRLADEAGVKQSAIGNIESGLRQRPRELVSIARALRVSLEWLETGKGPKTERAPLKRVGADAEPSVRALVEYLAQIAAQQRPTLRKNLANLLVDLVEHPEGTALIEQTIADIERFFPPQPK